ncbi:MAG: hypothetical protein Q8P20_03825 [bacterium]|nr:hypothetical protein [bacterium]
MAFRIRKKIKTIAYFLVFDMLFSICFPSLQNTFALTSGPGSPEFSSFEPVATTNMVDPFTGNFTYNLPVLQIPGPDGGGYAMSLSYHSGTSPEEESSWVGYGWTLNPGAINRSLRGLPDEYDGAPVNYYNKNRANWTVSGSSKISLEFFSNSSEGQKSFISLSASKYLRYNNFQGYAKTSSFGLSKSYASLSMNRSATGITFSATINPFALNNKVKDKKEKAESETKEKFHLFKANKDFAKGGGSALRSTLKNGALANAGNFFGLHSFTDVGQSVTLTKLSGYNLNVSFGLEINPAIAPIGIEGGTSGSFGMNYTKGVDEVLTYGYLHGNSNIDNQRQDYFTEKNQAFDKRDYFLGIPFSSPDSFMLTGEGLSGGFRAYRKSIGHFIPQKVEGNESKIKTFGLGVELMVGTNIGVGVNLAFGRSVSELKDWRQNGNTDNDANSFNEDDYTYRFMGDTGGSVEFGGNETTSAILDVNPNFPGIKGASINVPEEEMKDLNTEKSTSSSYIEEVDGGFSIYNDAGINYTYNKKVLVKNSTNVSTDINNAQIDKNYLAYDSKVYLSEIGTNYEIDECLQDLVVGEIKNTPYAETHLLTSITTPEYYDFDQDGFVSDNDFGGWTKFDYHPKYGLANSDWYRWRIPYNGSFYNKGSISDVKDDIGFVSTGQKEVYYLKQIETKTHIAYFVTNQSTPDRFGIDQSSGAYQYLSGTLDLRNDALGANAPINNEDPAVQAGNKNENATLEYLEKIVVFAKNRLNVPLQTTNFAYDYHLMSNLPNNKNGKYPNSTELPDSGKLTLRKVWSEFEGVVNARTSSYKFDYRYKDKADFPQQLVEDYTQISTFFDLSNKYSVNAQNPDYNPHSLDAWGNNQYDGGNRHLRMQNWPFQGKIPESAFDPAAWQLKQIKLPSGGEILVEYEENDYMRVQDRNVMSLVKLKSANDSYGNPSYVLDLADIGYDSQNPSDQLKIKELFEYFKKYFLEDNQALTNDDGALMKADNRIYFKFLYALKGSNASLENCKSEYITGYAVVKEVQLDNNELRITLNADGGTDNLVGVGLFDDPIEDEGYKLSPRQGCYDFYVTQRWGKFEDGCQGMHEGMIDEEVQGFAHDFSCGGSVLDNIGAIVSSLNFAVGAAVIMSSEALIRQYPIKETVCMSINPQLSYLRVPINKAKRGGGPRVKSLLMYDTGIEEGDAAIYGNTYKYILENGLSSGVATNEPQEMREENPLVTFLPKKDQSWLNRLIVGKDKEQSEGPIGESLLPGPSIGYSRIVVENIHTGKTGTGHTIHEFYTCKDYPFDKRYSHEMLYEEDEREFDIAEAKGQNAIDFTVLQENSDDDRLRIPTPMFNYSIDNAWAAQGYRFILNDMHGKPKSVKTYGGKYIAGQSNFISSGQDYVYFEPGEKIRLLNDDGTYIWDIPGKEMDVTMEKYRIYNQSLDFNFEIDVSVGLCLPPPIFASGWLQFAFSEQNLSKHAISKVIHYPVIQKKIISYSDNIASQTENLGFDFGTGKPILTRTTDAYHTIPIDDGSGGTEDHNGSIYALNIPAHWKYSAMGRKSAAVDPTDNTNQLTASAGSLILYGENANPIDGNGLWSLKTDRILSASANTFNTSGNIGTWMDENITDLDKMWRLHKTFTFKGDTHNSSNRISLAGKIYNGGVYNSFTPFDYGLEVQTDDRWVKLNEITKYSPHGNALEEMDALGIFSAAKFGYNFTQPIIIASNAEYDEIYFQDYEFDGNSPKAHSGLQSLSILPGTSEVIVENIISKTQVSNKGGWLKFWATTEDQTVLNININGSTQEMEKVARSGEWSLYSVFIDVNNFTYDQPISILLTNPELSEINVDDVKFQPKETQSICYVYDSTSLKLLAQFDDQHFGMFYQYNGEGKLVRKKIETERGIKTITETQYNLPREIR